jgi:hypothetical protein
MIENKCDVGKLRYDLLPVAPLTASPNALAQWRSAGRRERTATSCARGMLADIHALDRGA